MREFGVYRIDSLIGRGGTGEVHRAFDTRRGREVALKLLPGSLSADPEYQRRFRRESRTLARLREAHILPIHDYGEIDGRLYIDMPLVDGRSLAALLAEEGTLSPERAVRLIRQVAEALDAAHANGLVHRDVKPSNILVTAGDFVYVVDFGLAQTVGETRSRTTPSDTTAGTLGYPAPERFENRPTDRWTDVYSLACVLFECLTGTKPFPGTDLPALMHAHLFTRPPRPSVVNPAVPAAFDAVIATGMAKAAEARYGSAGALATAAGAALATAGVTDDSGVITPAAGLPVIEVLAARTVGAGAAFALTQAGVVACGPPPAWGASAEPLPAWSAPSARSSSGWTPPSDRVGGSSSGWVPPSDRVGGSSSGWVPPSDRVGGSSSGWVPPSDRVGGSSSGWVPPSPLSGRVTSSWSPPVVEPELVDEPVDEPEPVAELTPVAEPEPEPVVGSSPAWAAPTVGLAPTPPAWSQPSEPVGGSSSGWVPPSPLSGRVTSSWSPPVVEPEPVIESSLPAWVAAAVEVSPTPPAWSQPSGPVVEPGSSGWVPPSPVSAPEPEPEPEPVDESSLPTPAAWAAPPEWDAPTAELSLPRPAWSPSSEPVTESSGWSPPSPLSAQVAASSWSPPPPGHPPAVSRPTPAASEPRTVAGATRAVPPPATSAAPRRKTLTLVALAVLAVAIVVSVSLLVVPRADDTAQGLAPVKEQPAPGQQPVVANSIPRPTVATTVPVGPTPGYLEVAPDGRTAYIANRGAGVLTVFDTIRNQALGTIPVPDGGAQFIVFSPDGARAYVSIFNNDRTVNEVGVLDTTTRRFIGTVPTGVRPFALDVTPDGKRVYVPNHDSGSITVIDTESLTVAHEIKVAPNPHWLDVSDDGTRVYAANHESNLVSVIDTATHSVIATVPVGLSPHSIVVHPTRPIAINANYDASTVSVIDRDTNRVLATVPTGSHPQDVTLSADGKYAYVATVDDNAIQVMDTTTYQITASVPTGRSPTCVAVAPDGRHAYVTNLNDGTVTVLNVAGTA